MRESYRNTPVGSEQQWAAFTRWFRGHDIAWEGTSSELLSDLTRDADHDGTFADTSELLQFITQNTEALKKVGIQAALESRPGSRLHIRLQSGPAENVEEPKSSGPKSKTATSKIAARGQSSESASLIFRELSLEFEEAKARALRRRRTKLFVTLVIGAALVAVGLAVGINHIRHGPSGESKATADTSDFAKASLEELIRTAGVTKSSEAEEELARRYIDGRGAQRDVPAAYTWLVLARANGSHRDDKLISKLRRELSPEDLQKVRVYLGNAYARGIGVSRNVVTAHSWFELAEAAGSKDARIFRRSLEQDMTPEQIQRAHAKTAEWLSLQRTAKNPQ